MSSLKCFRCEKELKDTNEGIRHLKKDHFMIEYKSPLKCFRPSCEKSCNTFKKLRLHLKDCTIEPVSSVFTIALIFNQKKIKKHY